MYIEILKTHIGELGTFMKGEARDVPDAIVKQLPQGSYETAVAPHERGVDMAAREKDELNQEFLRLQSLLNNASDMARAAGENAGELERIAGQLQKVAAKQGNAKKKAIKAIDQAQKVLEDAKATAKEKTAANKRIATAAEAIGAIRRLELKTIMADADAQRATAIAELKEMEAHDARVLADKAAKKAEIKTNKTDQPTET